MDGSPLRDAIRTMLLKRGACHPASNMPDAIVEAVRAVFNAAEDARVQAMVKEVNWSGDNYRALRAADAVTGLFQAARAVKP